MLRVCWLSTSYKGFLAQFWLLSQDFSQFCPHTECKCHLQRGKTLIYNSSICGYHGHIARKAMDQERILQEQHIQQQLYLIYDDLLALFACDFWVMRGTNHELFCESHRDWAYQAKCGDWQCLRLFVRSMNT